jgi:hypothetical protein
VLELRAVGIVGPDVHALGRRGPGPAVNPPLAGAPPHPPDPPHN